MTKHVELVSLLSSRTKLDPTVNKVQIAHNFPPTKQDDASLLLKTFLKFADIGNSARPWVVCDQWASRVMQEFFSQGDQERKLRITISPFMVTTWLPLNLLILKGSQYY